MTLDQPETRRGRPPVTTDDQIFAIALKAFAARGFEAVSLRDLNRELGASHAMLAKRFRSKDDLWRATVRWAFARHLDALPPPPAPPSTPADDLDYLHEALVAFICSAAAHPDLHRVVAHEGCNESPRVDVLFDEVITPQLAVLDPVLRRCKDHGVIAAVSWREVFFLVATGAAAVHSLAPLSRRFDAIDGPLDPDTYASTVAQLLIAGLRT
jgi:AcrR family transcriptional regulator